MIVYKLVLDKNTWNYRTAKPYKYCEYEPDSKTSWHYINPRWIDMPLKSISKSINLAFSPEYVCVFTQSIV